MGVMELHQSLQPPGATDVSQHIWCLNFCHGFTLPLSVMSTFVDFLVLQKLK